MSHISLHFVCSFAPLCRPWTSSLAIEEKRKFDLMQKLFSSSNGCVFGRRTWSKPRCDGGGSASCWERRKWGSKKWRRRKIQQKFSLLTKFSLCLASLPPPEYTISPQISSLFPPTLCLPHPHDLTLVLLTVPVAGDSSTFCVCIISPPAILRLRVSNRRRFSRGFLSSLFAVCKKYASTHRLRRLTILLRWNLNET